MWRQHTSFKTNIQNLAGGGVALKVRFYLLGSLNVNNPAAISAEQMARWQNDGVVEYLGECEDVRPFIQSSSCVVLPSYREGVSMSLLEAMSMGKPIITSNAIGCKHLVREGHNGFLCEVRSAQSLADSMMRFIALNRKQRKQMGENARAFVCENYDISRIIAIYEGAIPKA